ncbi:helix-turn-helix domain-containing protein [Dickeya oryzae]
MMLSTMPSMVRFTTELVGWIENHLESPLMINDVTAKSGYSKWHLQRLFKKETGVSLGTYIRNRRLSKAAVELKLTSQTVQDVALRYCFDSQQSFTRTFKKTFWYVARSLPQNLILGFLQSATVIRRGC